MNEPLEDTLHKRKPKGTKLKTKTSAKIFDISTPPKPSFTVPNDKSATQSPITTIPSITTPSHSTSSKKSIRNLSPTPKRSNLSNQSSRGSTCDPKPYVTRYGRKVIRRYISAAVLGILTAQNGITFATESTMESNLQDLTTINMFKSNLQHYHNTNNCVIDPFEPNLPNTLHPCILQTQCEKDNLYYHEAMHAHDCAEFQNAMDKEVESLQKDGVFRIIPLSELPSDKKLIPMIWSFKRKRNPLGDLIKHKARLCVHGGKQRYGIDFLNTYAPVVNWGTVRLILTMTLIRGFTTRHVDYVLAFSQAYVDTPIYLKPPPGFHINGAPQEDYCLELVKNLYGTKTASKTWFELLAKGLEQRGFAPSKSDPCLFIRSDCCIITYVDDCLIFARSEKVIDELIKSLSKQFKLTDEGKVHAYLGIDIQSKNKQNFTFTQPHLIERILNTLHLQNESKMHDTPANKILTKTSTGPRQQDWNYRSVIGMMNFLAATTRPDILFAVHQCARFSINPGKEHEEAVKRIARYLKRTKDKGMIFQADLNKFFEIFVDADFAGSWNLDWSNDH